MKLDSSSVDDTASEGTAPSPPVIQAPSACPFSGVAIDQKMWESFQAKLATNNHHHNNHNHNIPNEDNDDFRRMEEGNQSASDNLPPPVTFLRRSVTTNYRVRVVNEATKRSKDMVVDQSGDSNLFNAVYNHPSLKEANIRKWGSQIAEEVKTGKSEIKVKVTVGDGSRFCQWYSLDELKKTTTRQLFQMIEEYQFEGPVVVYLVPVPRGEIKGSNETKEEEKDSLEEDAILEECESHSGSGDDLSTQKRRRKLVFSRSVTKNFLKVRVINQLTKRSKDMVVSCKANTNLYDSIYNHASVKDANVRKWGSDVVKMVKNGQSIIKAEVSKINQEYCRLFSVDELKTTSTLELYQELETDGDVDFINFQLVALPVDTAGAIQTGSTSTGNIKQPAGEAATLEDPERRAQESDPSKNNSDFESTVERNEQDRVTIGPLDPTEEASPGNTSSLGAQHSTKKENSRNLKRHSLDVLSMGRGSSTSVSNSMNGSSGNNSFIRNNASAAASSIFDSTMSDVDMSLHNLEAESLPLGPMNDQAKTTLGVRVINQTTQRHKDLVVTISDKDTIFDMVYDHPGVKSAHVRKWGGPIAKAVRDGTSFIRFSVWDDDTGRPWRVFTIEELKTTTTRQLYELVSESTNLVKIYLQCITAEHDNDTAMPMYTSASHASYGTLKSDYDQSTRSLAESFSGNGVSVSDDSNKDSSSVKPGEHRVKPYGLSSSASTASLTLGKTGRPQHTMTPRRQASIRLQEQGRLENFNETGSETDKMKALKKSGRPNHMNWAASQMPRNGSCPAIRHMYSSNPASSQRRTGSHDRLSPYMPKNARKPNHLPRIAKSAVDLASSGRRDLPVARRLSPPTSPLAGTKNESSKNAVWQPRKTPAQSASNKLLSSLGMSRPVASRVETSKEPLAHSAQAKSKEGNHLQPEKRPVSSKIPQAALDLFFGSNKTTNEGKGSDEKMHSDQSKSESQHGSSDQEAPRRSRKRTLNRRVSMSSSPQRIGISHPSSTEESPADELLFFKPRAGLKRTDSDPLSLASGRSRKEQEEAKTKKMKEFMRLLRTKKLPEFQSQRSQERSRRRSSVKEEISIEAPVPSVIHTGTAVSEHHDQSNGIDQEQPEAKLSVAGSAPDTSREMTDKINRFLRKSKEPPKSDTNDKISRFLALQKSAAVEERTGTKQISFCEADDAVSSVTRKSNQLAVVKESCAASKSIDTPPLTEICVVANDVDDVPHTQISTPGVALPPELVKEVFPYHVVLDANFRIIQIGNNLEMLVQESCLVGREVSDIMTITSPIPMFGQWDWSTLEKMKNKTIFLETVLSPAVEEKVKLKGTLIELSKTEKQIMLALLPNVKNLSELEEANLSMADLPLHSCQREAVLLGEHSKSEVNLTNHLDKLHRDLIDSMEQQIKERTEELAAANRSLETANDRLAIQSARQLEHFACMSHEIRTPLNCIVGMSSLLLDDADEMDPMHADSIRMINTSGDLLKAVVDDVLDYAKLESGSFEVDIKERNLQHTLNSVAHSISEKVRDKNVRLRLDFSPRLPKIVETDDRRLQQVLFNLLGNAGKFSKKNSVIDLTVSVVPVTSTDVNPDDTSSGSVIRFAVKDYGKGIEEKDFKSIFEPFSQASKETQNIYGGTGLGLSITTKLVHRLGGTISLKSEFGKYAEFTVDLPLRGPEVDVPKITERLSNTTIVLVDIPSTYDYSFTEYAIKPEPMPFRKEVMEAYNLDVMKCKTMSEALEKVEKAKASQPSNHFAVLLHEDLYEKELCEKLDIMLPCGHYTLMTFGPQYSVESTKERHFKSLVAFFPSALLESIIEQIDKGGLHKSADIGTKNPSSPSWSKATDSPKNELFVNAASPAPATGLFSTASSHVSAGTGLFATAPSSTHGGALFAADASPSPPTGLFSLQSSSSKPPAAGLFATADGLKESAGSGSGGLFSITSASEPLAPSTGQTPTSSVPSATPKSTEKQNNHSSARQALKVLYAEDNKVNQKVLSRVLARSGITNVTIVENGKEAVDITFTVKFDIIFMDIQMPVMGGMEATSIITERNPSEKVIFVTAHALDEFKAQAEAVGATSFISKPFRLGDIEELMQKLGY